MMVTTVHCRLHTVANSIFVDTYCWTLEGSISNGGKKLCAVVASGIAQPWKCLISSQKWFASEHFLEYM